MRPAAILFVILGAIAGCSDPFHFVADNPWDPVSPQYAPRPVTGLTVSGGSESSRLLSWNGPGSYVRTYVAQRRLGSAGGFVTLGTVAPPLTSFQDTSVVRTDTTYYYRILSQSSNMNVSEGPAVAWSLPFPSPAGLEMTCLSSSSVQLDWTTASVIGTSFRIESSKDGAAFAPLAVVSAGATSYAVSGLQAGSVYHFRVQETTAYNASRYSAPIGIRAVTQQFEKVCALPVAIGTTIGCAIAFSPDGTTIALGGTGGVCFIAAGMGTLRGYLSLPAMNMGDIAYSPAGGIVAAAHDLKIDIADPNAPGVLRTMNIRGSGWCIGESFNPAGTQLVCGGDSGVSFFDVQSGSLVRSIGGTGRCSVARLSPNGQAVAAGSPAFGGVLYRASDGQTIGTITQPATVARVAFSPDGKTLAVSGYQELAVSLEDAATGALILTLPGRTHGWSLAFSPDSRLVAAGDMLTAPPPGQETTMEGRLWNVADGSSLTTFPGSQAVGAVAFSPRGNLIALGTGSGADVWAVAGTWVPAP